MKSKQKIIISSLSSATVIGLCVTVILGASKANGSFNPDMFDSDWQQVNNPKNTTFGQKGQGDDSFDDYSNDDSAQVKTGENKSEDAIISSVAQGVVSDGSINQIQPGTGAAGTTGSGIIDNDTNSNNSGNHGTVIVPGEPAIVKTPVNPDTYIVGDVGDGNTFNGISGEASGNTLKIDNDNIGNPIEIINITNNQAPSDQILFIEIGESIRSIIDIYEFSNYYPNLQSITVSQDNEYFKSIDGVIYTKDGSELLYVPPQKKEIKQYSPTVKTIANNAFNQSCMKSISLPNTLTSLNNESLINSSLETITIQSTLSLNKAVFNLSTLKNIKCTTNTPPTLVDQELVFDKNAAEVIKGISIDVPDSKDNRTYYYYLSTWGSALLNYYTDKDITDIIKTISGYSDDSLVADINQNWYSHDGKVLEYASALKNRYDYFISNGNNGEVEVGSTAFANLPDVENIVVDTNIKELPDGIFDSLKNLKSIKYLDATDIVNPKARSDWSGITLYCDASQIDTFRANNTSSSFDDIVPCYSNSSNRKDRSTIYIYNGSTYELVNVSESYSGEFVLNKETTVIQPRALHDTTAITSFSIQTSRSGLKVIGASAFENSSITSINLADATSLQRIEDKAFYHCEKLFSNSSNDTGGDDDGGVVCVLSAEDDIYNSSVSYIGDYAFAYTGVRTVDLSRCMSLTEFGDHAFEGCTNLVTFNYSSIITRLSDYLFYKDTSLQNVIPNDMRGTNYNGLREIGKYTFSLAGDKDSSFDIYNYKQIDKIDDYAFYDTTFQEVWIDNVKEIGSYAFASDSETTGTLQRLIFYGTTVPSFDATILSGKQYPALKVVFPESAAGAYRSSPLGRDRNLTRALTSTISNSVKRSNAARGSGKINETWQLTDNHYIVATSIGSIFNYNVSVVNEIRAGAFVSPEFVTTVVLNNPKKIDTATFKDCSLLSSITLGNQLVTIGDEAFKNCTSLRNINIPITVTSIGKSAFENTGLSSVVLMSTGVVEIQESTFADCKNLARVLLSNAIAKIDAYAFKNCTSLTSLNVPEGVIVDEHAYDGSGLVISQSLQYAIDTPTEVTESPIVNPEVSKTRDTESLQEDLKDE